MKWNESIVAARAALLLAVCLVGAGFGAAGCQKDGETPSAPAAPAAPNKPTDAMKPAGDSGGKASVTDAVKKAIAADSTLSDPKNAIDAEESGGMVHLKGHVANNAMKKQAGAVATKAIEGAGSKDKVMNMLTVETH